MVACKWLQVNNIGSISNFSNRLWNQPRNWKFISNRTWTRTSLKEVRRLTICAGMPRALPGTKPPACPLIATSYMISSAAAANIKTFYFSNMFKRSRNIKKNSAAKRSLWLKMQKSCPTFGQIRVFMANVNFFWQLSLTQSVYLENWQC